ncbi:MAG: hypothetical protein IPJ98_07860 [Bryobacterales bacterium]|nr:hypothetical protein [Bryobacterales bacterium]
MIRTTLLTLATAVASFAADIPAIEYRVLATSKTSTMEKEMNEAAAQGFRFAAAMGGETAFGGKEAVVTMAKPAPGAAESAAWRYLLLATNRTSTMQKEIADAARQGYVYKGQTVFHSAFGGQEVAVILERDAANSTARDEYLLLATSKTSTMQKELSDAGRDGYELVGMTVGKTAMRGSEVLCILRRPAAR